MLVRIFTFLTSLLFAGILSGEQIVFDFYAQAPIAKWESAVLNTNSNALPGTYRKLAFGINYNALGSARYENIVMEDGRSSRVIYTHPQWKPNGAVKGFFPAIQRLPANAKLTGYIGFGNQPGDVKSEGGYFSIWAHYWVNGVERWERILNTYKRQTGKLQYVNLNLSKYANKKVFFEMRVDAGTSASYDRMCWKDLKVVANDNNNSSTGITNKVYLGRVSNIGELCPSTRQGHLVGGDREFGGPVNYNIGISYEIKNRRSVVATISLSLKEANRGNNPTTVKAKWERTIYTAKKGEYIQGLKNCRTRKSLEERRFVTGQLEGSGTEIGIFGIGCNDGKNYTIPISGTGAKVTIIGDTGAEDVSDDGNCNCDTKITNIDFGDVCVEVANYYDRYVIIQNMNYSNKYLTVENNVPYLRTVAGGHNGKPNGCNPQGFGWRVRTYSSGQSVITNRKSGLNLEIINNTERFRAISNRKANYFPNELFRTQFIIRPDHQPIGHFPYQIIGAGNLAMEAPGNVSEQVVAKKAFVYGLLQNNVPITYSQRWSFENIPVCLL